MNIRFPQAKKVEKKTNLTNTLGEGLIWVLAVYGMFEFILR